MSKTVTAKTYLAIKSAALAIGVIAINLVSCEPEPEPSNTSVAANFRAEKV